MYKYSLILSQYLDDFNRAVLEPQFGNLDSDYINASYVDVSDTFFTHVNIKLFLNVFHCSFSKDIGYNISWKLIKEKST